jgi:hypothetical protein
MKQNEKMVKQTENKYKEQCEEEVRMKPGLPGPTNAIVTASPHSMPTSLWPSPRWGGRLKAMLRR